MVFLFFLFQLLKEMYLLGRGELYLTLIDHLHITMKGPPTTAMTYGKSTLLTLDTIGTRFFNYNSL